MARAEAASLGGAVGEVAARNGFAIDRKSDRVGFRVTQLFPGKSSS